MQGRPRKKLLKNRRKTPGNPREHLENTSRIPQDPPRTPRKPPRMLHNRPKSPKIGSKNTVKRGQSHKPPFLPPIDQPKWRRKAKNGSKNTVRQGGSAFKLPRTSHKTPKTVQKPQKSGFKNTVRRVKREKKPQKSSNTHNDLARKRGIFQRTLPPRVVITDWFAETGCFAEFDAA